MDNFSNQTTTELKKHILIAEDDDDMGYMLESALKELGYSVTLVNDGKKAQQEYDRSPPDLIILDIIMPRKSGMEVATYIRSKDNLTPIFLHSARTSSDDVLEGLSLGVDDYLRKPTDIKELTLKVKNAVEKTEPKYRHGWFSLGELEINFLEAKVRHGDTTYSLQHLKAKILWELYKNLNKVYPTNKLIIKCWGTYTYHNGRSLNVHISDLNKVIKKDPNCKIVNFRAHGYSLINKPKCINHVEG